MIWVLPDPLSRRFAFAVMRMLLAGAIPLFLCSCKITAREQTIFWPHKTQPRAIPALPSVSKEDFRIASNDDCDQTGYLLRYQGARDFLLYFPGAGESAYDDLKRTLILCERNQINVMVSDYRGYGSRSGKPSLNHLLADSQALLDYVRTQYQPSSLFVFGHSLGTAPAQYLAANPSNHIRGVILEAPFTNARDAYRSVNEGWRWPLNKLIKLHAGPELTNWRPQPDELIRSVSSPLLLLHGTRDRQLPVSMSETLYHNAATPDSKKKLLCIDGAGHFIDLARDPATSAIQSFITQNR